MDLAEIRRLVIIALFADDKLMEKFVLKGGNALNLVHSIGMRSSVDIDVSIADDFDNVEDAKNRIFASLKDRFDSAGLVVFDEKFSPKPSRLRPGQNIRWGGYLIEFKLTTRAHFDQNKSDLGLLQRSALLIGDEQRRVFKIDISKYEFCEPKQEAELGDYTIYVYTLPMIAIEKLRAICQQMPEYQHRPYSKARARDFYDIHTVIKAGDLDLTTPENVELLKNIFEAKEVPLSLLSKIEETRDFHALDWSAVQQSATGKLEAFDFYFDFVVALVGKLKALGVI